MTDLDTFCAMLNRAGVIYTVAAPAKPVHGAPTATTEVTISAEGFDQGPSPANLGYWGFFTVAFFDTYGALVAVGAWE